jgi:hypothetical protein
MIFSLRAVFMIVRSGRYAASAVLCFCLARCPYHSRTSVDVICFNAVLPKRVFS